MKRNVPLAFMLLLLSASLVFSQDRKTIIHVASGTHPISAEDSGSFFDNAGATGPVTFTLLNGCSAEYEGVFFVFQIEQTKNNLFVKPVRSQIDGITSKNGSRIVGDKVKGSFIALMCKRVSASKYLWKPIGMLGVWKDAD